MIPLKSDADIQLIRSAGKILEGVLARLRERVQIGMTTRELDSFAEELIQKEKALPAFKGYKGYPASICVSVNEEVVHGIPDARGLKKAIS